MSEFREAIGSMPSVPELKLPQKKPKSTNFGVGIGFFLCAVCLLIFPKYADVDTLSAGVFYGMSLMLLLMVIIGLISGASRRVRENEPLNRPEASQRVRKNKLLNGPEAGSRLETPRRKWLSNGIGFGIVVLLFGVYLLTSPNGASIGDLSTMGGLITLLIGIVVLYVAILKLLRDNRAITEAKLGSNIQEQEHNANGIGGGVIVLFLGVCLLALPQGISMGVLIKGLFYGMGLIVLLLAIIALSSTISKRVVGMVSPGQ